jgi:hypothetical protein
MIRHREPDSSGSSRAMTERGKGEEHDWCLERTGCTGSPSMAMPLSQRSGLRERTYQGREHDYVIPPRLTYLISGYSSIPYFDPLRPMPDSRKFRDIIRNSPPAGEYSLK